MSTIKSNTYLYFLDGLRAVAIIVVLAFHSDNSWLSGGFLGVEIFFVISGFIITKLLFDEWRENGCIDLNRFWLRRLRRLIPAVFTVILATWVSVLLWFPDEINQIFEDLLYSLTFTNNWNYILNERSYFELMGRPRLFEHLWSLGVEFQFYLIWALLCMALFQLPRSLACMVIAIFALTSTGWMAYLYDPNADPSRIYFGTDTRASALFIGSIVALLIRQEEVPLSSIKCHVISFIGSLSFISLMGFCFYAKSSDAYLFQGGFVGVSLLTAIVIGTCLIISKQNHFCYLTFFLGNAIFRTIGSRAYGIYLWHWAIFSLTEPFVDVPFDGVILLVFRLFLTLFLSEITFRFIEKPIRNGCIERAFELFMKSSGYEKNKLVALWLFMGSLSLAGCSGLVIATEKKLETAQQYEINEAINETAAKNFNADASDVSLIESSENKAADDLLTDDNTPLVSSENTLLLASDPTSVDMLAASSHKVKTNNETKIEVQNRLQFEYNKNGKGYINRVKTVEKEGEKFLVFLLGDSVMMGATDELTKRFPDASLDSQVGRQLSKGIQILTERKNNNSLSDTVIIHLGNNSPINSHQIAELLALLSDTRKIIFVNLKLPRNYESSNNRLLEEAASKNSNIHVIDWHTNSMNSKNIFGKDGIHLTGNGAKLYANLISDALSNLK